MKTINSLLIIMIFLSFGGHVKAQDMNNFELFSATDNSHFVLSDAKGKFVALHFLLKTECPFCLRHTRDYIDKAETLPNVIQVFI